MHDDNLPVSYSPAFLRAVADFSESVGYAIVEFNNNPEIIHSKLTTVQTTFVASQDNKQLSLEIFATGEDQENPEIEILLDEKSFRAEWIEDGMQFNAED